MEGWQARQALAAYAEELLPSPTLIICRLLSHSHTITLPTLSVIKFILLINGRLTD